MFFYFDSNAFAIILVPNLCAAVYNVIGDGIYEFHHKNFNLLEIQSLGKKIINAIF